MVSNTQTRAHSLAVAGTSAGVQTSAGVHTTLAGLVAFAVALTVYWLTLAPDITWANASMDGGELMTAAVTLGIPHPPGYVTYVLAGKLFSLIPVGSVAWRFNLFSAVSMAVALGFVSATCYQVLARRNMALAAAAALSVAFLPFVWGQALVAEVYALNALVVSAFLFVWAGGRRPLLCGLLLGLAITTHLTSLLLIPLLLVRRENARRTAAGVMLGLSPLLALPLLASGASPVVWGDPADLAGWWWLVTGRLYQANLSAVPVGIAAAVALLLGAIMLFVRVRRPDAGLLASPHATSLALAAVAVLYLVFTLSYRTPDSHVLLIPAVMMLAVSIVPLLRPLGAVALILPLLLALFGYSAQDLSADKQIRPATEALLSGAPQDALVLTPGDRTIFTLWYFQHVERQRTDLRLVDINLFAFDWYRDRLALTYPDLWVPEADDLDAFRHHNEALRPVCSAELNAVAAHLDCGGGAQ